MKKRWRISEESGEWVVFVKYIKMCTRYDFPKDEYPGEESVIRKLCESRILDESAKPMTTRSGRGGQEKSKVAV